MNSENTAAVISHNNALQAKVEYFSSLADTLMEELYLNESLDSDDESALENMLEQCKFEIDWLNAQMIPLEPDNNGSINNDDQSDRWGI